MALPANSSAVPPDTPAPTTAASNFTCTPFSPNASLADPAAPASSGNGSNATDGSNATAAAADLSGLALRVQQVSLPGGQPYGSWKLWTTDPYNFTVLRWNASEAEVLAAANDQLQWVAGQTGYSVGVSRSRCADGPTGRRGTPQARCTRRPPSHKPPRFVASAQHTCGTGTSAH